MDGIVRSLFISPRRNAHTAVSEAKAVATGLSGDRHSDVPNWRQVLLLSVDVLERFGLDPGILSENVLVEGLNVMALRKGQRVRIGEALFEVTIPCEPCSQMEKIRSGLRAELKGHRGMFVKVIEPGTLQVGDIVEVLETPPDAALGKHEGLSLALTIAGSDSSGGAGIQADLKTFSALKVYGMSVIAALTAQNTTGVSGVMEVDSAFVALQIDTVVTDLRPDAVKTGMLSNAAIIESVAAKLRDHRLTSLVVDPVMVAKSGAALLRAEAMGALRESLLPLALIVTPNTEEAEVLTGATVRNLREMETAAGKIHAMGSRNVLIKGGHLEGDAIDVFFDGNRFETLRQERISTKDSHGTGCVLSAAITAHLALGKSVEEAVRLGKAFVTDAIRHGLRIGGGHGPCDPLHLKPL
jgi:hydroxymethylpyrimidine/phosphomethylpyrimidine kinase